MEKRMFRIPIMFRCGLTAGLLLFAPIGFAQQVPELPNLEPLPAFDIHLVPKNGGQTKLVFSMTSWNSGVAPLVLIAGETDSRRRRQKVYQRVYYENGGYSDSLAGFFEWHRKHHHIHFEGYASYALKPIDAPGGSQRTGSKTTFCILDTDLIDTNLTLPGTPNLPFYSSCGMDKQGMSVGWGDTYKYWLSGQEVDFTGNPEGKYQLEIKVDPKNLLVETDENDNASCVLLNIDNAVVTVLDDSGSCI